MSPARHRQPLLGVPQQVRSAGPARFKLAGESKVDVKEASDVVALPKGGFVVVGGICPTARASSRPPACRRR